MEKEDVSCVGPVVMTFEDDDVMSCVRIGIDEDLQKVMKTFAIGTLVKVKCRVGFTLADHSLSLTSEEVDLLSGVKIVVE